MGLIHLLMKLLFMPLLTSVKALRVLSTPLMTDALILGTQLKKNTIDTEIILAASNNLALH